MVFFFLDSVYPACKGILPMARSVRNNGLLQENSRLEVLERMEQLQEKSLLEVLERMEQL